MKNRITLLVCILIFAVIPPSVLAVDFKKVDDSWLPVYNGRPIHAIGVNYFDVFLKRLTHPEDTSFEKGFAVLQQYNVPFARFVACGCSPKDMVLYNTNKEKLNCLMQLSNLQKLTK